MAIPSIPLGLPSSCQPVYRSSGRSWPKSSDHLPVVLWRPPVGSPITHSLRPAAA